MFRLENSKIYQCIQNQSITTTNSLRIFSFTCYFDVSAFQYFLENCKDLSCQSGIIFLSLYVVYMLTVLSQSSKWFGEICLIVLLFPESWAFSYTSMIHCRDSHQKRSNTVSWTELGYCWNLFIIRYLKICYERLLTRTRLTIFHFKIAKKWKSYSLNDFRSSFLKQTFRTLWTSGLLDSVVPSKIGHKYRIYIIRSILLSFS